MVAEKLRQQAKALENLDHPNIVRLIELRDAQDYGFFSAIEFVDGESLAEVVRRGHLPPPREVVRIARSVATALNYVHGKSIVYGRVRPEHILLDRTGHVFLTGFGEFVPINPDRMLCKSLSISTPEEYEVPNESVPQTDVHGLARVVFLLLTGSPPFHQSRQIDQSSSIERLFQVPSIRRLRPEFSRKVDLTLQRAMAFRPEDRYPSAGQFVEELDQALQLCQDGRKKWWHFWR